MHSARFLLPLLPLLGCDDAQRTPSRDIAVPMVTAREDYSCPHDAEPDGYLYAPVPSGLVSATVWRCYPTGVGAGAFAEGCEQDGATLLVRSKSSDEDAYLYLWCADGDVRIDWLLRAEG